MNFLFHASIICRARRVNKHKHYSGRRFWVTLTTCYNLGMKKLEFKFFKKMTQTQRYYVCSILFLMAAGIFLTWFLEYRYFINDFSRVWSFVFGSPAVFFFNAFLMFLLICILWGLTGAAGTAAGIGWCAIMILTYIHINKFKSRGNPLLPEDFQLASEAGSLSKFVSVWSIMKLLLSIAIIIALTFFFNKKIAKKLNLVRKRSGKNWASKHALGARAIIVLVAFLGFFFSTDFARHNDGSRYEDIFLGTHFTAWNQNRNYDDNGFILGFLYNLQKLRLEAPGEYTEEAIARIEEKYTKVAEERNETRLDIGNEDVSVVVILNESFYDPDTEFNGLRFTDYYPHDGGEITPVLHELQRKYPSGQMYSLDYGGGTANIEFETFTGLTNFWVNTVPYTALIPRAGKIPSIASYLKDQGYTSTAIHPFNGGMYKRNIALKNEGFDEFITELEMDYDEHDGNSEYINDRSAYRQVIKTLQEGNKKQVIGLVTMQNHTPYNFENYETRDFHVLQNEYTVGLDENKIHEIETYYQTVHNSDAYLGEFIQQLEQMDKKVVVLFYGDHSPGIFDVTNSHELKEVRDLSRVTPYFIYANYDAGFTQKELPTTTPNCMVNTTLNALNWKKNSRYYMLDDVCQEQPILTATWLDGRNEDMETELMHNYEMLTFDILGGKKYWHDN